MDPNIVLQARKPRYQTPLNLAAALRPFQNGNVLMQDLKRAIKLTLSLIYMES